MLRGINLRCGSVLRNCNGQATTELLLVSVWFFIVVLLVIQLTVTLAGDEAASYVAYMSARANTVDPDTQSANAKSMTQKLQGAIPWADWVSVAPAIDRPAAEGNVRNTVRAPSLFLVEALGNEFRVAADEAAAKDKRGSRNPFLVEASAEMPGPAIRKSIGDNDLF